jgi:tRNA pseudouridine38-40 synthase
VARLFVFTAPDEPMPECTLSLNARMSILPTAAYSAARWTGALNARLPPTIRVLRCRYVSKDFHARVSAKGKIYRYRIWSAPVLPPFEHACAWHIARPLNLEVLRTAAKSFVGTHDFASFAANRGKRETSTIRTIYSVHVRQSGSCLTIEFDGDGFLYKMVRLIVGSLVKYALGKLPAQNLTDRLASAHVGSARFAAPPKDYSSSASAIDPEPGVIFLPKRKPVRK